MNLTSGEFFIIVILVILAILYIKRVRDYERLVISRAGRFHRLAGPGLVLLIPGIDRGFKISVNELDQKIPGWQALPKEELERRLLAMLEDLTT